MKACRSNYFKIDGFELWIKRLLTLLGMVMIFGMAIKTTSYAYTQEEIASAKAWLSAHGYSPDESGASQAYQDYLNGKWDKELGINRQTTETSETGTEADNSGESWADAEPEGDESGQKDSDQSQDAGSGSNSTASVSEADNDTTTELTTEEASTEEAEKSEEEQGTEEEQEASEDLEEESAGYEQILLVVLLVTACVMLAGLMLYSKKHTKK